MHTKYVGTVTDVSWHKAVMRLPLNERRKYLDNKIEKFKYDEGLSFIYSLNRYPRVYWDEV